MNKTVTNILIDVGEINGRAIVSCLQNIRYTWDSYGQVLVNRVPFLALSEIETYGFACIRSEGSDVSTW